MYTGQKIFEMAMTLIGKREANGNIDGRKTASYKALAPDLLTAWQAEISKNGDLFKTFYISNKPIKNMIGVNSGFDYVEYQGKDITFEGLGQAKAYYFEVDGGANVYIEDYTDKWNLLTTIYVPDSTDKFTSFKGVLTPTDGAVKTRIRFSGQYRYLIVNYALYDLPLSPTKIPDYKPWVKVELPDDFKCIDKVIIEYPQSQYSNDISYKLENRKDFYYNYYFEGQMRVNYKPVPVVITDLSQELEVDEITSMSGAYFLATHMMLVEDPDSANYFLQKYQELKAESVVKQPVPAQRIVDVYSVSQGVW